MIVVINSSPLIVLGKLNLLYLLKKVFTKAYIPGSVYEEVVAKGMKKGKEDALVIKMFIDREKDFIKVREVEEDLKCKHVELDAGEREVIRLAQELKADFVIIDEENARREARGVGLKIKGTIGVLILGYKQGFVSFEDLQYIFEQIKVRHDIWISSSFCERILEKLSA